METCAEHPLRVPVNEEALFQNFQVHDLLLGLSTIFTIIACISSFIQIYQHATNYTVPKSQRQIIRILFMAPVYCICCTISVQFYEAHVYIAALYEFYESLVVAAFFLLLCQYIQSDMAALRRVFNMLLPLEWIIPIRIIRAPLRCWRESKVDGLRWLNIIWLAIHQFCLVKFIGAIVKCVAEARDVYCAESNSRQHLNIWVTIIEILSLIYAMLFLLQFYQQTKDALKEHNPLFKFIAVKLVIFLFLVQTFLFERLTGEGGPLQPTAQISFPSLAVGIPNTILCFEMAIVSFLHLWAYPSAPYRPGYRPTPKPITRKRPLMEDLGENNNPSIHNTEFNRQDYYQTRGETERQNQERRNSFNSDTENLINEPHPLTKQGGVLGWKAMLDAINITDIIINIGTGFHWLFVARRKVDSKRFDYELEQQFSNGNASNQWKRTQSLAEAMARV